MEEELTEEVELAKRRIDEINTELNQVRVQKGKCQNTSSYRLTSMQSYHCETVV